MTKKTVSQTTINGRAYSPPISSPQKGGSNGILPTTSRRADEPVSIQKGGLASSSVANQTLLNNLAAAVSAADEVGQIDKAIACASAILAEREGAQDPFAPHLRRLLIIVSARLELLPAMHEVPRLPVHFDDRVAHAFEQLLSLIHQQDVQIAELRQIVSDLI